MAERQRGHPTPHPKQNTYSANTYRHASLNGFGIKAFRRPCPSTRQTTSKSGRLKSCCPKKRNRRPTTHLCRFLLERAHEYLPPRLESYIRSTRPNPSAISRPTPKPSGRMPPHHWYPPQLEAYRRPGICRRLRLPARTPAHLRHPDHSPAFWALTRSHTACRSSQTMAEGTRRRIEPASAKFFSNSIFLQANTSPKQRINVLQTNHVAARKIEFIRLPPYRHADKMMSFLQTLSERKTDDQSKIVTGHLAFWLLSPPRIRLPAAFPKSTVRQAHTPSKPDHQGDGEFEYEAELSGRHNSHSFPG